MKNMNCAIDNINYKECDVANKWFDINLSKLDCELCDLIYFKAALMSRLA